MHRGATTHRPARLRVAASLASSGLARGRERSVAGEADSMECVRSTIRLHGTYYSINHLLVTVISDETQRKTEIEWDATSNVDLALMFSNWPPCHVIQKGLSDASSMVKEKVRRV